ncbi:MAG: choice-of-anchor K domain-containing protein [Methylophilaceae bacterium]
MKYLIMSLAIFLSSLNAAQAETSISGTASGIWVNPQTPQTTTGVGTSSFSWGLTQPPSISNLLTFTPVSSSFSGLTEAPFKVGTISFRNGTTRVGSPLPEYVSLAITLNFTSPNIPSVSNSYIFDLITTLNTADPNASADIVKLPSYFPTTSFIIDDTEYFVQLSGFQNVIGDGFLSSNSSELRVRESLSATADLYAIITTQALPVPEPSEYALLLAGFIALAGISRLRKN